MVSSMRRDKSVQGALGISLHSKIKSAKVLMVGAGGIGCELLKNLILTGFGEIHIVDLDTIDLSNLNRQFLFNMQHIKKSKALVAKETAGRFNPNVKLEAYHSDITNPKFNLKWFQQFDLVFNALDNLAARRHVNAMCLGANVPLIESGTTGFNGQVQVIKKGDTECYDCTPKPVIKSFPVCTIRSTPSQPIHCIVWAKSYLFNEIFGQADDNPDELNHSEDSDNAEELKSLKEEAEELKRIRETMGSKDFAKNVFDKVFDRDINRLLSMQDMWKTRKAPTPLDFTQVSSSTEIVSQAVALNDQLVWSLHQNFAVFVDSLQRLSNRVRSEKEATGQISILSFDKDDIDTLDFVTASANLRSIIFGIETKSKFDIKQMAGNIIPAIATTNAITAGLCVIQAFKVLRQKLDEAKMVFLSLSAERALNNEPLRPPNPHCEICSVLRIDFNVDTTRTSLKQFVEDCLVQDMAYQGMPSIMVKKNLIYDSDYDDNVDMTLLELDIRDGTVITIADESDEDTRVNIDIFVTQKDLPDSDVPYESLPNLDIPLKAVPAPDMNTLTLNGKEDVSEKANGIVNRGSTETAPKKRKLDDVLDVVEIENSAAKKKSKPSDDIIVIDDGYIEID